MTGHGQNKNSPNLCYLRSCVGQADLLRMPTPEAFPQDSGEGRLLAVLLLV